MSRNVDFFVDTLLQSNEEKSHTTILDSGLGELSLRTHVWSNLDPIDEAQRPEKEIALT